MGIEPQFDRFEPGASALCFRVSAGSFRGSAAPRFRRFLLDTPGRTEAGLTHCKQTTETPFTRHFFARRFSLPDRPSDKTRSYGSMSCVQIGTNGPASEHGVNQNESRHNR